MNTSPRIVSSIAPRRLGGVSVLLAVVLPMLAILTAFAINSAHMQMVRTELMIASDAAARSAGRTFSEEQTVADAMAAAQSTAALNNVNGDPVQLAIGNNSPDIEFGSSSQANASSRFEFTKIPTSEVDGNALSVSSIRINAKRSADSPNGPVRFVFPTMFAKSDFSPEFSSIAMQVDRDISLVLDRSGSMEWRTYDWPTGFSPWSTAALDSGVASGELYRYRGNLYYSNGSNQDSYFAHLWQDHLGLGALPPTPWEDLVAAVDAFLNVLDQTPQNEQVSVASYSSSGTLDHWLTHDFQSIRNEINTLQTGGNTGIGNGMNQGKRVFDHQNARPFASKTMVVMTDGIHNSGVSPNTVASQLMSTYNMNIQTVTFGSGANQDAMRTVATIGQGKHYHADSGQQLVSAFEEIANNLPTILTK
ncbi:VWA domain-containing protein [Neorhodopirellula pilleata]|uniref:von Willebrand factor type A domain protein n=1 Tax=Neorhodopirellula pilleata TaxID=2714738 RepID=A0A5C5ZW38_9BACT|nr:VWA domain-containing protein [Neorhodopirellula pilleata]TWT91812.1 von Willebrand factor type A domain protein [Neorhodopirellula pilleata]